MFTLQKPNFAVIYDYWEEKEGVEKRFDIPDDEYHSGRAAFYGLTIGCLLYTSPSPRDSR